jgi:hypothetical protein
MADTDKEVIVTDSGGGSGAVIAVILLLLVILVGAYLFFGTNLFHGSSTTINVS